MVSIPKQEYEQLLKSQQEIAVLKAQLVELKRMIFGSKSERFIPSTEQQLGLFTEQPMQTEETVLEQIAYSREKSKTDKKKPSTNCTNL